MVLVALVQAVQPVPLVIRVGLEMGLLDGLMEALEPTEVREQLERLVLMEEPVRPERLEGRD